MPRTRSLAWAELKIGIVAVVAMILAIMIIVAAWESISLKSGPVESQLEES